MGRAFEYRKARKLKRWGNMARTAKAARQYDFPRSPEIEFYLST